MLNELQYRQVGMVLVYLGLARLTAQAQFLYLCHKCDFRLRCRTHHLKRENINHIVYFAARLLHEFKSKPLEYAKKSHHTSCQKETGDISSTGKKSFGLQRTT